MYSSQLITVNPGLLSIECCSVRCFGETGRSVGGEVNLLSQLYHGDVVVIGVLVEALMVGVLGHRNIYFL